MSKTLTLTAKFESEAITEATYDRTDKSLTLEYTSGGKYRYKRVPLKVWKKLAASKSAGRFVVKNVRTKFTYERID